MLHKAPFIGGVISTDLMLCYFSWIKAYVDLLGKIFHQIMLSLYQTIPINIKSVSNCPIALRPVPE